MSSPTEALLDAELGRALLEAAQRAQELEHQQGRDLGGWADPVAWCRRDGARLWEGQERILRAIAEHDRVAIPGGHGLGKGHVTAWLTRWWLARPHSRVLLTGNTNSQVKQNTWHELKVCHVMNGWPGVCMEEEWRFEHDPTRQAFRMTTDDGDAFQGKHAPNFLVVFDESAGDRLDKLWPVVRTLITKRGGKIICIGNPTRRAGAFAKIIKGDWGFHVERISSVQAAECQRRRGEIPGVTDWSTIETWARDCGYNREGRKALLKWIKTEGTQHDWFRPRVLGLVPLGEGGGLFTPELLESACARKVQAAGPLIIGIDVARMGGDQTVVAVRRGQSAYFAMRITGPHDRQLVRIGEWLTDLKRAHEQENGPEIKIIRVDATGEGSAMPDMLAAQGWPVKRVHFGGKPKRPDKFKNRRAEGYRRFR